MQTQALWPQNVPFITAETHGCFPCVPLRSGQLGLARLRYGVQPGDQGCFRPSLEQRPWC